MNSHPTPPGIANPPRPTHLPSFQQLNISPETHQGRTSPSPPACRLGYPLTTPGHSESRTYNIRGQLTRQTGFGVDISYGFSSTANDGRIQTRTDHVSGETVEYQYDQLGRLLSAATQGAGGWGLAWNHDGFGNLTQQSVTKGSLTGFTHSVNGTTNRINGQYYDANGNWGGSFGQSQSYDIENRIRTAAGPQFSESYLYSARNERMVSQRGQDRHRVHFYGADGLLLGIYSLNLPLSGSNQTNPSYTYPVRLPDQERVYFGGRLLQIGGEWVATDRLGSVVRKGTTNYKYAPYGQEIGGATDNDTTKFATYTRDSISGLDYALNRYYKPEWGRFTSPDPYQASGGPADPGSWNRYSYNSSDPVNYLDPSGLFAISVPDFEQIAWSNVYGVFYVLTMLVPDLTGYDPPSADGGGWHRGFGRTGPGAIGAPACPYPTPWCGVWNGIRVAIKIGTAAWAAYEARVRRFPTLNDLMKNCAPGRYVSEPATGVRYSGATSHEQEYICPAGPFTHHWIELDGKILHSHIRPGSPKAL